MTDHIAVFGSPIAHSKSPVLHRTAYRMLGFDWHYDARDVRADELSDIVINLDDSWRGLSLTMPLKTAAFELAGTRDAMAELTGAVNTLRFTGSGVERRLSGYNTDVTGIVRALSAVGVTEAAHVHILGGGATAASAVVAAAELGALSISVATRTPEKAGALIDLGRRVGVVVDISDFSAVDTLARPQLVISTLPGGTGVPVSYPDDLPSTAALLDVAYDPWPSALASAWSLAGGTVANGLSMLVHQALIQVRIFAGDDPFQALDDEDAVLAAMLASVGLDVHGIPLG